ncbi:MAG: Acg family FMN-binding oxidoreductase [Jatrophihabitans sp.]
MTHTSLPAVRSRTRGSWDRSVAEAAVEIARRAPSIHNTQPWRWHVDADGLTLLADPRRQLAVADPDGHSLLISCGAALRLTELGLQSGGWQVDTHRMPDPARPEVLARFSRPRPVEVTEAVRQQASAALRRHSDRRPFQPRPVPADLLDGLRGATDRNGVHVHFPARPQERTNLAVAVSWADRIERHDDAYVAELARWLRPAELGTGVVSADGVVLGAVPMVGDGPPRHTDVPLRDFELGVSGRELIARDVDEQPSIAVLLTDSDSPLDQLLAGEAMMALMLAAEQAGLSSCPLSQAVDLIAFRSRLHTLMGWQGCPQMMLRIGYPATGAAPQRTPRRLVTDVLSGGWPGR